MSAPKFFFIPGAGNPDFAVEVPIRAFEPERPYPQNPQVIVYRTRFAQLRAYYTKPAPNTPHPDLPQVYFADDVEFQDRTAGLVEWTRVYTTLPTSWNDFASESYDYPGYLWIATPTLLGRNPFSHTVTTKVVKDYYAVGSLSAFTDYLSSYDNFNNVAWTNVGIVSITTNANSAPVCAGSPNSSVVQEGNSSGQHYMLQGSSQAGSLPGAVFVRREPNPGANPICNVAKVAVVEAAAPNLNSSYVTVDLRYGSIISSSADATPRVSAIDGGWWRIGVEKLTANFTNAALLIALCDDAGNDSYVGQHRFLDLWRGQIGDAPTIPHASVPPTVAGDATTNYPINVADQIPQKFGIQFLYAPNIALGSNIAVEYLSNGSTPNYNTWANYVVTDNANSASYSVESQDSVQSLWYGSIWERNRKFVKAR